MRKLLLLCLVAALAKALPAQTPGRSTGTQPTTTSKNTNTSSSVKQRTNSTPASTDRSALQPNSTTRPNAGSGHTETTAPNLRSNLSNAGTNTTANRDQGLSKTTAKTIPATTAKTVPAQMPAAPPKLQQDEPLVKVQWMTLEEATEKAKTEKRKIFIDVFTDWCGWCKRMDESTFVDPEVAEYLNDNYYPVKLNAEQQEDINFNNKTYHFRKNGARGYHELAAELLNNRLSFPTVVFLDESMNVIQAIPTYLEAPKLETILNYFGTDSHKTTPWETYEKKFTGNQQR